MSKLLTQNRDTDLLILEKLTDIELLKFCVADKETNLCDNESFWANRFISKYGKKASKYKPNNRSWKNHYMKVIIDLHHFESPMDIFRNILWSSKGTGYSLYKDDNGVVHFFEAPDFFMTNFWLFKFPYLRIYNLTGQLKEYSNSTPYEILSSLNIVLDNDQYVNGFRRYGDGYLPVVTRRK